MKRALILSASFALAAWAAPAVAQNSILTGKYGVTGTTTCNISTGAVAILTSEDIHTFYADGTGAVTLTSLVSTAGAIGSAGVSKSTYTFKYTVNHDRSFTVTTDPGSVSGTFVSGPNTGVKFSVDQFATITGFIGIYAT